MTEETNVLLTKKEVAKCLSCSVRNVDTLRKTAGLPYVLMGRLVRFRPSDIQECERFCKRVSARLKIDRAAVVNFFTGFRKCHAPGPSSSREPIPLTVTVR